MLSLEIFLSNLAHLLTKGLGRAECKNSISNFQPHRIVLLVLIAAMMLYIYGRVHGIKSGLSQTKSAEGQNHIVRSSVCLYVNPSVCLTSLYSGRITEYFHQTLHTRHSLIDGVRSARTETIALPRRAVVFVLITVMILCPAYTSMTV